MHVLYLSDIACIQELPNSVGGMTSLVTLNIDENLLSSLPSKVRAHTKLDPISINFAPTCIAMVMYPSDPLLSTDWKLHFAQVLFRARQPAV